MSSRQEIGVEPLIATRAFHPDVAGAQSVSYGGQNGCFVAAVIDFSVNVDQALPRPARERLGNRFRQFAGFAPVSLSQDFDSIEDRRATS